MKFIKQNCSDEHAFARILIWNVRIFVFASTLFTAIVLIFAMPAVRNVYVDRLTSSLDSIPKENYGTFDFPWAQVDHLTDCIALSINVPETELTRHFFHYAFYSPAVYSSGSAATGCPQLIAFLSNPEKNSQYVSLYSRYWHGYIVVLQPLVIVGGVKFAEVIFSLLVLISGIMLFLKLESRARGAGVLLLTPFVVSPNLNLLLTFSHSLPLVCALTFSLFLLRGKQDGFWFMTSFGVFYGTLIGFISWLTYPALFVGLPVAVMCIASEHRGLRLAIRALIATSLIFIGWLGIWALKILLSRSFGPVADNVSTQFDAWTSQPRYVTVLPNLWSLLESHLNNRWYWTLLPLVAIIGLSDPKGKLARIFPGILISAITSLAYWVFLHGHAVHTFSYTNLWGLTVMIILSVTVMPLRAIRAIRAIRFHQTQ